MYFFIRLRTGVNQIYSMNNTMFIAVLKNGLVSTWGDTGQGLDTKSVRSKIKKAMKQK